MDHDEGSSSSLSREQRLRRCLEVGMRTMMKMSLPVAYKKLRAGQWSGNNRRAKRKSSWLPSDWLADTIGHCS